MNLQLIKKLAEKHEGGLKRLASEIGMSEANLHRCINHNRIQAGDLEMIAITLNADIRLFFDVSAIKYDVQCQTEQSAALLQLCKAMVENNQQRDGIMSQLASMVKAMEE